MCYLFPESFSELLSPLLPWAAVGNPTCMGSLGLCSKGGKIQVLSTLQPEPKLLPEQVVNCRQRRLCFAVFASIKFWKMGSAQVKSKCFLVLNMCIFMGHIHTCHTILLWIWPIADTVMRTGRVEGIHFEDGQAYIQIPALSCSAMRL